MIILNKERVRKIMQIGLTYDTQTEYGYKDFDVRHCDFISASEVSFLKATLEKMGHSVFLLGNCDQVIQYLCKGKNLPDLIFNMSWGFKGRNREGLIPALLEAFYIPFTGSDAYGCSLCLDKLQTKLTAIHLNIPTPMYIEITNEADIPNAFPFPFPVVLKPRAEGSSMGVNLAQNMAEAKEIVKHLLAEYNEPVLCEQYIEGREIQVPLLVMKNGVHAINVLETTMPDGSPIALYNAELKHSHIVNKRLADIPQNTACKLAAYAEDLFQHLGCRDFGRADFRVTAENEIFFLEMAPLPSLQPGGSFHTCCKLSNINSSMMLEKIITSATRRI